MIINLPLHLKFYPLHLINHRLPDITLDEDKTSVLKKLIDYIMTLKHLPVKDIVYNVISYYNQPSEEVEDIRHDISYTEANPLNKTSLL